jgi:hypothetical protein
MEDYISNYDTFNKKIVYIFQLGDGGIGDCIKFFVYVLELCIKYKIQLYYQLNNIPIEKYIQLKYKKMYIQKNEITNSITISANDIPYITSNNYNIVTPFIFYNIFDYNSIVMPIEDVFEFSNDVIINSQILFQENNTNYISIHLRLGDRYLETDKSYVLCQDDSRLYNYENICQCIEHNKAKYIIFFCDNKNYKLSMKEKYNNIIILESKIGHTSLSNTTDEQIVDTISEFYLMTQSEKIYSASLSGFSIIASKFKNIPLISI